MRREIINWTRPLSPMKAQARAIVADFGRNVKARRMAAGLSQPQLSRLSGVSERFICKVECVVSNPSLETMAMLAAALNCTVTDLLASTSRK
jgi:transcriptional regulator with XRE-family HTH domain